MNNNAIVSWKKSERRDRCFSPTPHSTGPTTGPRKRATLFASSGDASGGTLGDVYGVNAQFGGYIYTLLFEKTFATLYNKYIIYIMIWNLSIPRRKSWKHDYEQIEHDIRHVCQDIFSVKSEFLRFPFNLCLWEVPQWSGITSDKYNSRLNSRDPINSYNFFQSCQWQFCLNSVDRQTELVKSCEDINVELLGTLRVVRIISDQNEAIREN